MTGYCLKVNKTKLYTLAKQFYPDIELCKKTEFKKYYRRDTYSLKFYVGDCYYYAIFRLYGGYGVFDCGYGIDHTYHDIYRIPFDELQKLGLLVMVE